uniref:Uncharacterized protein n=1 Tax=Tanacetum cinerariifolium TaxID=118510 RepID=A0A6L2KE25_TANCI|nr:hypothetical protein [Tanacetum cinerariifolium]
MLVIKRFRERMKVFRERKLSKNSYKEVCFSAGNRAVFIGRKTQRSLRAVPTVPDISGGRPNTCNNGKNLSEIQLEHEKEDELVVMVVKVVHKLDCMMVVKEIENGLLEEIEKFGWWFEQDIGGENEDDREKKLVMVSEEGWMS